ncbi:phage holin family protein [Thermobifida fusca]|jgi:hypothetical protein|uniref:Integral membrane protein n=2 Tax=Thermobifida fusca TaxID=2021 RepID=A0A9P2T776_THEFU|nr:MULTISPECIES: phage holin family protein [Thermobifida]AAZ57025.1 conserved hypothetical protein [Thermobifida fusca YX]EOR69937.1 hypothetical protein TM51_15346 [Thermobifida fusca TM51]MBO2530076.1 phage holin family protein [Thermobifida sp.]MDD6791504.1 phage holin family protein [Thermobifida fusca]PPS94959.1 hypothetical protein BH05_04195 [Thermobifida fusca]
MASPQIPQQSTGSRVSAPQQRDEASLGELISEVMNDLQTLFRQELNLAKAEFREEGVKAGKAAGMLAGAGVAALLFLGFASLALVYALANVMDAGWAALIVAVLWGIAAGALAFVGRAKMRDVSPKPERTIETLKEDAQWAKHPRR